MADAKRRARKAPVAPGPSRDSRRLSFSWAAPVVVGLAGVLTYAGSFDNPFVLDDMGAIPWNSSIRDLSSWQVLAPQPDTPVAGRPLINLSFAINYALGGTDVWGYHAVSLAIHVLCGLLVLALARRTLSSGLSLAIALLWVVHPLNSEVVNYLTQRTESMMAAALLFTIYAATMTGARQTRWQVLSVVTCVAGMACKETMVVAPLAVLLYDAVYVSGSAGAALRARGRLYACLAAAWVPLAVLVATGGQDVTGGFTFLQPVSPWTYLMNQAVMITEYLRLSIWPDSLVAFHGWASPLTLADVWPSFTFVTTLFLAGLVALWRRPKVGALAVWVFLTLAPMSSILPIVAEVGAERRMYLPLIGLVALAVLGAAWIWARLGAVRARAPWVPAALVGATALAFSVTSMARTREYASRLTLTQTILARWPSPNAQQLVGSELVSLGRFDEALPHFRAAAEGFPMARYYLGEALVRTGKANEAIAPLEAFLPVAPPFNVRSTHLLLALAYQADKQPARAIDHLKAALALAPDDAASHALLADAFAGTGAFAEAIPHYEAFLKANPSNTNALTGLGVALVATGRGTEAVAAFQRAADAEPGNSRHRQNLARALADHGDARSALKHAQEAVTLDARDPASFEVLGRVLLRLGRTADARLSFERALKIDPTYAPAIEALRAMR